MDLKGTMDISKNVIRIKDKINAETKPPPSSNDVDEEICSFLKRCGYNFGVKFPCSIIKHLYDMLEEDNDIKVVTVTREEEGIGVSAGAYLAGKKPFMLIQSSGLGNSFNAIASLLKTYKIPILILASYRGHYNEKIPAQIPLGRALPGMLDAMEIPFLVLEESLELLETFCLKMFSISEPHVVLLSPELYENE